MISLFANDGGVNATAFLADHAGRVTLLVTPGFLSRLHYAEAAHPEERFGEIDVRQMTVATLRQLGQQNARGPDGRLYVVADETGEGMRLEVLREAYPNLDFKGLAQHLFPALVARLPMAVFEPVRQDLACREITLILATKRSGSSYLADVVRDCGLGDAREHLRNQVIEALASDYRFNRPLAWRNFLNLITVEGRVASKVISHFLADYLRSGARDLALLAELCAGITPRVILLDRSDKVGQAVSAYLAGRRGLWHVQSDSDAARLESTAPAPYNFNALLVRYAEYRQQPAIFGMMRDIFPRALELDYDRDVAGQDPATLTARLAQAFGLEMRRTGQSADSRQRLANAENAEICARFTADYRALFGVDP